MVSDSRKTAEITEAEKRELIIKVYPRLRKRQKLLRFFRMGNAVLMALLITACATTQAPKIEKSETVGMQIKKGLAKGDDPKDFEKSMPDSDITLATVVRFSKEPTVKRIADNVIDLDYEDGLLVLLKKDRIETNRIDCPIIHLKEDRYLSVQLEKGLALITGAKSAVLADVSQCGTLHELPAAGKGFALSDKYMLQFSRNRFELSDSRKTREVQGGDFLGSVNVGLLSGENIMFANENGKLALMNGATGRYTAIYPGILRIKQVFFEGDDVYVYDEDNLLRRLTADYQTGELIETGSAQAKDGCFFMKRSGMMFCDGYIFGLEIAYESPIDADRGLIRDGLIFVVKDGDVSFVDTTLKYKKSALLQKREKRLCLKDGLAYFKDFDGKAKFISAKGEESPAEKMPDKCDHRFDFKKGALSRPDGSVIFRYGEVLNSSEKAYMIKRVIGETIYYYFERLSD